MAQVSDLTALAAVVADFIAPAPASLDDTALTDAQTTIAGIGRLIDAIAAGYANEIAYRSRPELGHSGLAQRRGTRTPEKLIQTLSGSSFREAQTLVRVGELIATPSADSAPTASWLVDVAAAVTVGTLSLDAADAIRSALGTATVDVTADDLLTAATTLLQEAPALTLEQLAAQARNARAELDLDRVRDREAAMRDRRYLRFSPNGDGMTKVSGLLDPESAVAIVSVVDAVLSPRRGPRFVDPSDAAAADELVRDERTNGQLVADAFVELIDLAQQLDDGAILGSRRPVVQIHVTQRDLDARRGLGRFDGQLDAVSIETVERYLCASGSVPILLDQSGTVLDVGREQRTFTRRQRIALAARDGGCRFPGCDRPASWTEAHHIVEWSRGGCTDVADGILLCKHHHLLVHNNDWRIEREHADYYLLPPIDHDPLRRRIPMPSKNRTYERALQAAG